MLRRNCRSTQSKALLAVLVGMGAISNAQDLLITGVRIEPVTGSAVDKGSILIQGGRIVDVGTSLSAPQGVPTLDASGMVAYPGFIDGFSSRGLKLPDAPAAAPRPPVTSTAPATMWAQNRAGVRAQLNMADCLDLSSQLSDFHKAGITSAYLLPSSGMLRGTGALVSLVNATDAPSAPTPKPFGMGMAFRGSAGGGGGFGGGYPGTGFAWIAHLRQTLYDAQNPTLIGMGDKVDKDLQALSSYSGKGGWAVFSADTELDIVRALRIGEEFNLRIAISGGREAYKRGDMLAKLGTPVILNADLGTEPSVEVSETGPPKAVLEERRDLWRERAGGTAKLHQAGVNFAFSSDGDSLSSFLGNVRKHIQRGLPKEAALKALTMNPAKIFGAESSLGSIEKGKVGNIILMSGDFADEKSVVKHVIVAGKQHEIKEAN